MKRVVLLMVSVVLCFAVTSQASQIAEWQLNGNLVDSVGVYDAFRVNAPSYSTGFDGQALDYAGGVTPNPDNVTEVPYNAALNTDDFTVSTWVKVTGGAGNYRTVVSQRDQYLPASGYIIYANASNNWEAWVGVDNGGWWIINGSSIIYDKWTHVALSYNSTTKQAVFSVNGTAYSGDLSAYTYVPNASKGFRIGCGENEIAAGTFYMDGLIDHIQLWNNALSSAELAQMYADMTQLPIAEWRLDSDLTDSVGTYDASRVNPPNYTTGIDGQALDYYTGDIMPSPDNVIEVSYDAAMNTADFTVSAWVNITGGSGTYRAVVSARDQYAPASGYIIYATVLDQWQAWIAVNGGGWFTITGPAIAYDKWTHVALSYDSITKQSVFSVDGVAYTADLSAYTYIPNTSRGFRIGCGENENPSGAFYMDGVIDHVQLWDKALTAAALAQMYAGMAPSRMKIAEWRFDGDLTDSGGTYDAARVNIPSYTDGIDDQALDYMGSITPHVDNVTEVPYDASLNTADFTVSAWVNVTGGSGMYRTVVSARDQYTPASGYIIYANSSENWEAWVGVDNGGWWIINGPPITYDKWTQVALSYDSLTKKYIFSVSGSFYNGTTGDYTYVPNAFRGFRIGCGENEVAAGTFYMDGLIDNIQLWDYALDELEIGQVYADISGRNVCTPKDGAVDVLGVNPLLEWNSQPGATGYNIYFSDNKDSVAFRSDVDGSRDVDFKDMAVIAEQWQMNGTDNVDLDYSGVVDFGDIQLLVADWLVSDNSAFKGTAGLGTTTYATGQLVPNMTYYWRIDVLEGSTVYKGDVWEFKTYNSDGLTADLYDNKNFTQQEVTRIDGQVAFDWATASPDPAIGADTFSIAWEGGIQVPEQGEYTFYTSSDDGVRLYVNDILIIDHWYDQGLTEHTGQIKLRPGTVYPVRLDYYENSGSAAVYLSWSGPGISKQIIPQSFLTSSPTTTSPDDIWVVDVWQQTMTERLLTLTLQGLVSKDIPSIWVVHGGLDSYMRQDLEQDGTVFHDNASVWVLLDWYRDFVEGIIVCGSDLSSINAATSLCGPMNAIAVDESLLARVQSQTGLPVLVDVRGSNASTIYNNYQNLFSHEFVVDVAVTDYLRDLSVRYNAFTFYNVSSNERQQYVGGLTSQGAALGWGSNHEYYWIDDLSRVNASGIPADYCKNLSALSKIRTSIPSPPMKYPEPAQEGQRIVAFVMSDGDNLQVMEWTFVNDTPFFGSPYRGTFSMNWEFPPYMAELAPLGVKQYYDLGSRGTNVDCFITGGSGAGYAFPNLMPDPQLFAQTTGRLMEKCRLKVATILNGNGGSMSDSDELLDRPEVMGVVYKDYYDYNAQNGAVYWHNGKPCASYKYLLWDGTGDWNSVSSAIASMPSSPTTNQNSYALVNAHAWSFNSIGGPMEAIKRTVDLLPPNTRVVTVDEFIILLRNNFGTPITEQEYNGM